METISTLPRPCTIKKTIQVGAFIDGEISFASKEGGNGVLRLCSWRMDSLFKEELAKLQSEPYVFSTHCRNINEQTAWYSAITIAMRAMDFEPTFVD
jgi:hypothetical protein